MSHRPISESTWGLLSWVAEHFPGSKACQCGLEVSGYLLTFVLGRLGCFKLVLSVASKPGESKSSASRSSWDLRFLAEAVICFEVLCFSNSAPPVPRPTRLKVRAWVGGAGISGSAGMGVVGGGECWGIEREERVPF